jgi:hypothetical protein
VYSISRTRNKLKNKQDLTFIGGQKIDTKKVKYEGEVDLKGSLDYWTLSGLSGINSVLILYSPQTSQPLDLTASTTFCYFTSLLNVTQQLTQKPEVHLNLNDKCVLLL